jgi:hypothetical protein
MYYTLTPGHKSQKGFDAKTVNCKENRTTKDHAHKMGKRGWEFFSPPPRPERLWGLPTLVSNGYQGLFPWGLSGRGVKLTSHLHLVQRSKNEWSYTSTPPIRLHGVVLS